MLTVARESIKTKLGISGSGEDAAIDACIAEQLGPYETGLNPDYLANATYLETLNLAATDWIAGEYSAQRIRADGRAEAIVIDGIEIKSAIKDVEDPLGLKSQSRVRLMALYQREQTARALAGLPAAAWNEVTDR